MSSSCRHPRISRRVLNALSLLILLTVLACQVEERFVNIWAGPHAGGPSIGAVAVRTPGLIDKFGKFEISFAIAKTTAANPYFPYEPTTPAGIPAGVGINVDALFLLPGESNWSNARKLPCFYYQPVEQVGTGGDIGLLPVGAADWRCRFTPEAVGTYQYKIKAQDAGGIGESVVARFTVQDSARRGFVQVSSTDSQFFEFSDGTPFVTPLVNVEDRSPFNGLAQLRSNIQNFGQNAVRFLRWFPTGEGANFYVIPFGDDMRSSWGFAGWTKTDDIDTAAGKRLSYAPAYYTQQAVPAVPGARYRLSFRARVTGDKVFRPEITDDAGRKLAALAICANPALCSNLSRGWQNYSLEFMAGSATHVLTTWLHDGYVDGDNAQGTIRIDSVSLQRDETGNSGWGANLLSRSDPDTFTYVDQLGAARLDEILAQSEQAGVYHKLTLFHKNDNLLAILQRDGTINGNNFDVNNVYSADGLASRWYQRAYARYFVARWSYSTALHSLEYANENVLTSQSYDAAFAMAQYIKGLSPRHILLSNSFWGYFVNDFWSDPERGSLMDYADKHWYANPTSTDTELVSTTSADSAANVRECWSQFREYRQEFNLNKPIVRGEMAVAVAGTGPQDPAVARDSRGTYYHKQLWAQVGAGGYLCGGEWYPGLLSDFHLWGMYGAYERFMQNEKLQNGSFHEVGTDLAATDQILISNVAGSLRAWGTRDARAGRVLLWVDNAEDTWRHAVDGVNVPPAGGALTIQGLPAGAYAAEWWDTVNGSSSPGASYAVGTDGRLTFTINNLKTDSAVKFIRTSSSASPTSAPPVIPGGTPAVTPEPGWTPEPSATPVSSAGLLGYWRFDENGGPAVVDSSGLGHNGVLGGRPGWVAGVSGMGLAFGGMQDYVEVGDDDHLSPHDVPAGEMTVAAWVKLAQLPPAVDLGRTPIVAKGGAYSWEYGLHAHADGTVSFVVWQLSDQDYGRARGGKLALNTWHHVVGTLKKGQYVRVYVDGVQVGESSSFSGDTANGVASLYVARSGDGQYFNGTVDEVRLYGRALSQPEIQALAAGSGGLGPTPTPTRAANPSTHPRGPISMYLPVSLGQETRP